MKIQIEAQEMHLIHSLDLARMAANSLPVHEQQGATYGMVDDAMKKALDVAIWRSQKDTITLEESASLANKIYWIMLDGLTANEAIAHLNYETAAGRA